jgi:hypothetical protein
MPSLDKLVTRLSAHAVTDQGRLRRRGPPCPGPEDEEPAVVPGNDSESRS